MSLLEDTRANHQDSWLGRVSFIYVLQLQRVTDAYTPNRSRSSMPVIHDPSSDESVAELRRYLRRLVRGAAQSRIACVPLPPGEERANEFMRAGGWGSGESAEVEQLLHRPAPVSRLAPDRTASDWKQLPLL